MIYTLAAGAPQFSCADINHRSTAIKALTITTGLTELYLDVFFSPSSFNGMQYKTLALQLVFLQYRSQTSICAPPSNGGSSLCYIVTVYIVIIYVCQNVVVFFANCCCVAQQV